MPKQSSRQQEIGDLFKSSYNTTSTGASTSTENNRSTTQESNASSARQQEIAGLWGNRQVYTQPTTNTANHNTPTTPKTTKQSENMSVYLNAVYDDSAPTTSVQLKTQLDSGEITQDEIIARHAAAADYRENHFLTSTDGATVEDLFMQGYTEEQVDQ